MFGTNTQTQMAWGNGFHMTVIVVIDFLSLQGWYVALLEIDEKLAICCKYFMNTL